MSAQFFIPVLSQLSARSLSTCALKIVPAHLLKVITKYEDVVDESQGQFGRDVLVDSEKRKDELLKSWGRAEHVLREYDIDEIDKHEKAALVGDNLW